ncbi:hypothetical protein MHYP_G00354090 [Metynnis hypsauchen]
MESVMGDLKGRSCFIYIDDIVVYSASVQQHLHHLQEVFDRLHRARLTLNLRKCNLLQTSLNFLGHVVGKDGISMEPRKIEAVRDFPQPGSVKEVQRFLRMAGWYNRFIPHFAGRADHLNALKWKTSTWAWTGEWQKAFDDIKQALIIVLVPPDFNYNQQTRTVSLEGRNYLSLGFSSISMCCSFKLPAAY